MDRIPPIIHTLIDEPHWTDASIARLVGCEPRRVRRYRRLLKSCVIPTHHFKGCSAQTLDSYFNRRDDAWRHEQPDFAALVARHPRGSGLELWRAYQQERAEQGLPAMSYSQFQRRRRKAEGHER